jgi:hypothetical protein
VKEWATRQVRAWNAKPGDVVEFYDTVRRRVTAKTVQRVLDGDVYVAYRYRGVKWSTVHKRHSLIRIRRLA